MRLFPSRFLLRPKFGFACALLAAVSLLGACNRHSADEVPESYGHGSNRNPTYNGRFENHEIDSKRGTKSYSDTTGTDGEEHHKEGEHGEKGHAVESPEPSKSGQFFPSHS